MFYLSGRCASPRSINPKYSGYNTEVFFSSHSNETRRGAGQAGVASADSGFPPLLPTVHPYPCSRKGRGGSQVLSRRHFAQVAQVTSCRWLPRRWSYSPTQLQGAGNAVFFPRDRFPAKNQALGKGQVLSNKQKPCHRHVRR